MVYGKNMKKLWPVLLLVLVVCLLATQAEAADVFSTVEEKLENLFNNIRRVLYVAGAFGLASASISGIMGKLKWQTVAHTCAALFILVIAGEIIRYATGGQAFSSGTAAGSDPLAALRNEDPPVVDPDHPPTNP
jgi:type IV secretory pathway VirB2 component (pilin)